ncbi:hypothetical protein O77CONTIG1_00361 [Leptolyngbya sp. O-77]|nr:hypothetical protein O77CONTIG1_00361 [Leptolyngbya sp. O-77]
MAASSNVFLYVADLWFLYVADLWRFDITLLAVNIPDDCYRIRGDKLSQPCGSNAL